MAQSSRSVKFICRSCRQSILKSTQQSRAFSNSTNRPATIPSFHQTSSTELDILLSDWRRRVFTPAALNTTHQALIYKKSRRLILENDPGVTVTMSDGEEVKLEPMDAYDKPNKKTSLTKLTQILGETDEADAWSQIPSFLEGMQMSRQTVPMWFLEKLTRKANERGKAGIIKQCAAMVKKTGLSLAMKPVTRELFLGCHARFVEANLLDEDLEKEIKFVESLALMLESPEHCGAMTKHAAEDSQTDMRKDLTVLGVLLEFAAAKATKVYNGEDVDGKVGSYARKLTALAGNDVLRTKEQQGKLPGHAIEDWLPIANGIRLGLNVIDLGVGKGKNAEVEVRTALKNILAQLDKGIQEQTVALKAESQGKPRRALEWLKNMEQS